MEMHSQVPVINTLKDTFPPLIGVCQIIKGAMSRV